MTEKEVVTALLSGERRVVEITALKPNPDNPKSITRKQLDRLKNSLSELGYILPILVNQDLRVIDGHQRVKALMEQGVERVEVQVITLEEEKELLALLATDQTYGSFDRAKRQDIINLLESRHARLDVLADYFESKREEHTDTMGDLMPRDVEEPSSIEYGQVIRLGRHYLICGDSRDPDIWKKVVEIGKPYLLVTSPPYFNQREEYASYEDIQQYMTDMEIVIKNALGVMDDCVFFYNVGMDRQYNLPAKFDTILEQNGLHYQDVICWKKPNLNLNNPRFKQIRSNKLYYPAFQWEPCLVYYKGERHRFDPIDTNYIDSELLSDVWEFTTVRDEKRWHPAPFPESLPRSAIQCYSSGKDIVIDPFVGSGTTIFASEEAKRVCIGIEMSPEYCHHIVREWNDRYGSTS